MPRPPGGSTANHDIKKWYFKDTFVSGGLSSSANAYTQAASSISISFSPSTTNPASATISARDASGNIMPNQYLNIFLNGVQQGATVNTGGSGVYTYTLPSRASGTHTLAAVATAGGSTNSATYVVTNPLQVTTLSPATSASNDSVSATFNGRIDSTEGQSTTRYFQYRTLSGGWTSVNKGASTSTGTHSHTLYLTPNTS